MTDDLDDMFSAARADRPTPSDALIARVLHDADAVVLARAQPQPPVRNSPGPWARAVAALGGVAAFAGMATAAVAGVWIGFAQPLGEGIFATVLGSDLVAMDMMPGIDALLDEDQ